MIQRSTAVLFPELRSLLCTELARDELPEDPGNCSLYIQAEIGVRGQKGADTFGFTVVTPRAMLEERDRRWGRGYLILPEFRREAVEQALQRLLSQCSGPSWTSIAAQLNKELLWEYDSYKA